MVRHFRKLGGDLRQPWTLKTGRHKTARLVAWLSSTSSRPRNKLSRVCLGRIALARLLTRAVFAPVAGEAFELGPVVNLERLAFARDRPRVGAGRVANGEAAKLDTDALDRAQGAEVHDAVVAEPQLSAPAAAAPPWAAPDGRASTAGARRHRRHQTVFERAGGSQWAGYEITKDHCSAALCLRRSAAV